MNYILYTKSEKQKIRNVKTTLISLLFLISMVFAQAQNDFTKDLSGIKKVMISTGTQVQIIAGDSNNLIIGEYDYKSENTRNNDEHNEYNLNMYNCKNKEHDHFIIENSDDKSKGLKAIYANGIDNTGFGMLIEKRGDVLRIKDLKSFTQRNGIKFTLPKTIDISLNCGNLGSARIENFTSEIEVESNVGHIHLVDVTGPITASSSTGGINVEFVKVNQDAPISIRTATASVDVTLPENTNANLVLKSTMGTVYTNFDLDINNGEMKNLSGNRKIVAKLNNGGVRITLSSSTGNVYLRKKE